MPVSGEEIIKKRGGDVVDWLKIRQDYINGGGSYRGLAAKYKISISTLEKRARSEGWYVQRKAQRDRIDAKARRKIAEKIANQEANRVVRLLNMADRLSVQLDRAIDELDRQMVKNKHKQRTIQYTDPDAPGKPTKEIIDETEEVEIAEGTIDRLGVQQLATALKNLRDVITSTDTGDPAALRKAKELLGSVEDAID